MWKKNIIKIIKKNKTLIYYTLIEYNFQMTFFHWSIHGKKKNIYTIQNIILLIYLFKITSLIGDTLSKF
jgi:hypothetical protein